MRRDHGAWWRSLFRKWQLGRFPGRIEGTRPLVRMGFENRPSLKGPITELGSWGDRAKPSQSLLDQCGQFMVPAVSRLVRYAWVQRIEENQKQAMDGMA